MNLSLGQVQNEVISKSVLSLVRKHSLEHPIPAISSNIERLFEVLLILRGQLAVVGRLLLELNKSYNKSTQLHDGVRVNLYQKGFRKDKYQENHRRRERETLADKRRHRSNEYS